MAASAAVDLAWQLHWHGPSRGSCSLGHIAIQSFWQGKLGKCIQGYSPISHIIKAAGTYEAKLPTSMRALKSRKAGAMSLVDTILSHAGKAGGVRIEARLRDPAILQEAMEGAEHRIEGLMALLGRRSSSKSSHCHCTWSSSSTSWQPASMQGHFLG